MCAETHIPGQMSCKARVRTDANGKPLATTTPQGLVPADLISAYNLPTSGGTGMTVGIVDAQDDPNAESDLAKYRAQFGLPACTTANGCFKKVGQTGTSTLPTADSGWAGEISLDLDMVSAVCPNCKILLVEATSASQDDLGEALNAASQAAVVAISNSWSGSEDSSETSTESTFNQPGKFITVSNGDSAYGAQYPASSQYVIAVGGTSLTKSSAATRGWVEGVWGSSEGANDPNGGTGSGCSAYITKPTWQKDSGCSKRMVGDVSAVADPNTGVAVYDTYGGSSAGATGWIVVGGTSAASPIVASALALTGHATANASFIYANTGNWYDVTTGTNGTCPSSTAYFCNAEVGYDGPTGWGTPNGAALAGTAGSTTGSATTGTTTTGTTGSATTTTGGTGTTTGGTGTTTGATTTTGTTGGSTTTGGTTTGGSSTSTTTTGTTGKSTTTTGGGSGTSGTTTGGSSTGGTSTTGTTGATTTTGTTGGTTGGSTTGGTTGGSGSCSHGVCSRGSKLKASCNPCAEQVCEYGDGYYYGPDPYCCHNTWDSICVAEAAEECGECY